MLHRPPGGLLGRIPIGFPIYENWGAAQISGNANFIVLRPAEKAEISQNAISIVVSGTHGLSKSAEMQI